LLSKAVVDKSGSRWQRNVLVDIDLVRIWQRCILNTGHSDQGFACVF